MQDAPSQRPDLGQDALVEELQARNRLLVAQAEALRARLAEAEDEIVRLTRLLEHATPDAPEPETGRRRGPLATLRRAFR
jgi:hypothetical protein